MKKFAICYLLFAIACAATAAQAQNQAAAGVPLATQLYIANDATTGTTVATLTKLTSSGKAIIAGTGDNVTGVIIGVTVSGAGTSGSAVIADSGTASCVFDGATTAGDFVVPSTSTGGDCHDSAATMPTSGQQVIGRILSTNASGGTYTAALAPAAFSFHITGTNCGSSTTCASPTTINTGFKYAMGTVAMAASTTVNVSGLSPAFTSATSYSCWASDANGHAYTSGVEITSASAFTLVSGTSNSDTWIWGYLGT